MQIYIQKATVRTQKIKHLILSRGQCAGRAGTMPRLSVTMSGRHSYREERLWQTHTHTHTHPHTHTHITTGLSEFPSCYRHRRTGFSPLQWDWCLPVTLTGPGNGILWMIHSLGSAVWQCPPGGGYHALLPVAASGPGLLACSRGEHLPGGAGWARTVSICLHSRQRPEDLAGTWLLNKAIMSKAQLNTLFRPHQSAPPARPVPPHPGWLCQVGGQSGLIPHYPQLRWPCSGRYFIKASGPSDEKVLWKSINTHSLASGRPLETPRELVYPRLREHRDEGPPRLTGSESLPRGPRLPVAKCIPGKSDVWCRGRTF